MTPQELRAKEIALLLGKIHYQLASLKALLDATMRRATLGERPLVKLNEDKYY